MRTRQNGYKTEKVERELRCMLDSGILLPGSKVESLRILAKRLDVGKQAVASAVEKLVKEGLLVSSHGRGTFVTKHRNNERLKLGFYIHVDYLSIDNMSQFHACSIAGIRMNYDLLFANRGQHLNFMKWASNLDGLIVSGYVDDALIGQLIKTGKPFLVFGNYRLSGNVPNLQINFLHDIEATFTEAARIKPFRRIGAILGSSIFYSTVQILDAMREYADTNGKEVNPAHVFTTFSEEGYAPMESIMALPKSQRPEAVIVNRVTIRGIAQYVEEKRIPKKNLPLFILIGRCCNLHTFPLSTPLIIDPFTYQEASVEAIDWISSLIKKDGLYPSGGVQFVTRPATE